MRKSRAFSQMHDIALLLFSLRVSREIRFYESTNNYGLMVAIFIINYNLFNFS